MKSNALSVLIFLGDITLLYLAVFLTLIVRHQNLPSSELLSQHLIQFSFIYLLWILVFYLTELYNWRVFRQSQGLIELFIRTQAINAALAIMAFYLIPLFGITPKTNLFINLIISTILLGSWRLLFNKILIAVRFQDKLAIIGLDEEAREIIKELKSNHGIGYRIVAATPLEKKPKKIPGIKLCTLEELNQLIQTKQVDAVLTAFHKVEEQISSAQLYSHIFSGVRFIDTPTFYESFFCKIPLSLIKQTWFLENIAGTAHRDYDFFKRFIDIISALIGVIISLVIYPFIILAIFIEDGPGPIFYKQKRVGQNGTLFTLVKFRTMKPDAEKNGARFAKKNDRRVTKAGNFLRRTRLDELPQLWNVLFGSMSLIGPRPERPKFVQQFEEKIPYYQVRHLVKPGLSGWAQINYEYAGSLEETYKKLQFDIYYIKNRSLLLDLGISLKTISIILRRAGQ
jgi:sugar transferase (PEP-CTERM system associated)